MLLALVLSALLRFATALRGVAQMADSNPLRWVRWTPPQDQFHRLNSRRKLLRAGNQVGKTWATLAEVIWRCSGYHPHYAVPPVPIKAWIVCSSWSQSVVIMTKFKQLCPAELIDWSQSSKWSAKNGFGKDNPFVRLKNGSEIRFKTTGQGGLNVASATLDLVLIDEPTTPEIYRELTQRLKRTGGTLLMSLTPVNLPCGWIEEMVEDGVLDEVHAELTVENLTPVAQPGDSFVPEVLRTKSGEPMDEAWIAEERRLTPPAYAPVVLDGAWNAKLEGTFFTCFDPRLHVAEVAFDARRGKTRWTLGIDYAGAAREHGQVGYLCQVQQVKDDKGRRREVVYVVDEVVVPGVETNSSFARMLLEMLERNGLAWHDLDEVYGDNPVMSRWVRKSNIETMRAVERELGMRAKSLQPRILSSKEGLRSDGMVDAGLRYLWALIKDDRFRVHPRCVALIEALQVYDASDRRDDAKDRIDGVRYALKGYIFPRTSRSGAVLRAG